MLIFCKTGIKLGIVIGTRKLIVLHLVGLVLIPRLNQNDLRTSVFCSSNFCYSFVFCLTTFTGRELLKAGLFPFDLP